MQKTVTISGKRTTAGQITKLPHQETNGGDFVSKVQNTQVWWNYRQRQDGFWAPVCDPKDANCIRVEVPELRKIVWVEL